MFAAMSLFAAKPFLSSTSVPYVAPSWVSNAGLNNVPKEKLSLGRFATPLHPVQIPDLSELGFNCFIKRDDLSSCDLSGNKVRKLEFLLAAALANKHDCVITIGGLQSNHARATAVAAKQLGLDAYLILRKAKNRNLEEEEDIGLTGNLLFNRMVGAKIRLVEPSLYAQIGGDAICAQLAEELRAEGKNPYVIPVGGSNSLGAFGYIECVRELLEQQSSPAPPVAAAAGAPLPTQYDHIVFACGSGGTAAGMAIGARLSGLSSQVHAVGVCDTPDIFYGHIEEVAAELGIDSAVYGGPREWIHIYPGNGIGYAKSTTEELDFLIKMSTSSGVILDPVYSGKALYYFVKNVVREHPERFRPGQSILFIHTGGTFGLYEKEAQVLPLLPRDQVSRMNIRMPPK